MFEFREMFYLFLCLQEPSDLPRLLRHPFIIVLRYFETTFLSEIEQSIRTGPQFSEQMLTKRMAIDGHGMASNAIAC